MSEPTSAKSFLNSANTITASSLAGAFVGLIFASQSRFGLAAVCVVTCAVLDSFDGVLARKHCGYSPFGAQLDSLADIVAFGVVPAFMLHAGPLESMSVVGLAASLVYLLCGAWRLARFPLIESSHRFLGLPIPPAGLIAALTVALAAPPLVALALTFVLSILMISEVPFPTFRALRPDRGVDDASLAQD